MKVSGQAAPFGLRMPETLKRFLTFRAFVAGRSINSEIIKRIANTITKEDVVKYLDTEEGIAPEEYESYLELFEKIGVDFKSQMINVDNYELLSDKNKRKVREYIMDLCELEVLQGKQNEDVEPFEL